MPACLPACLPPCCIVPLDSLSAVFQAHRVSNFKPRAFSISALDALVESCCLPHRFRLRLAPRRVETPLLY